MGRKPHNLRDKKMKAKNIIQLHANLTEEISDETTIDEIDLDSLDKIEILMGLEEEYEIEVDDEVASSWKTVGDICEYFEPTRPK
jgi:acyl carrier protein